MSDEDRRISVKQLFVTNFNINEASFRWDVPLEQLDGDFKKLSYLLFLEQLLNVEFKTKILVLEKINSSVHTPKDIINLIEKEL
jgi:hypothetical protein